MTARTYGPTPLSPAIKPGTTPKILDSSGVSLPLLSGPTIGVGGLTFSADDGGGDGIVEARIVYTAIDGTLVDVMARYGPSAPAPFENATDPDPFVGVTPSAFGLTLLALANAAALRTAAGLGSAATSAVGAFDAAGAAATAQATAEAYTDTAVAPKVDAAGARTATRLVPTATKTSGYTAAVGDHVVCDISGGSFAITLPTAPADLSEIGIDVIATNAAATNTLTFNAGGSDVVGKPGGSASGTVQLGVETLLLQYKASVSCWYILAGHKGLSSLDGRYTRLFVEGGVWSTGATSAAGTIWYYLGHRWVDLTGSGVLPSSPTNPRFVDLGVHIVSTSGGPPSSGAFTVGALAEDTTYGLLYQCTVAGSPGTWVLIGGGGRSLQSQTSASASSPIGSTPTLLLTLPAIIAPPVPLKIRAWTNQAVGSTATGVVQFNVFDEAVALAAQDTWTVPSNGAVRGMNAYNEISYTPGTSKTFSLYGRCLTTGTATYGNPILGLSVGL